VRTHPDHDLPVTRRRHPLCPDRKPPAHEADVPLAFAVGDHSLPAGEYAIYTVTPERMIRIASADERHAAVVNTLPNYAGQPSTNSRLAFHKYGNKYFLAQVWTAAQDVARDPLSSNRAIEDQQPAAARPRPSLSSPSPTIANKFVVIELSGRVHRVPFFCSEGSASVVLNHPRVVLAYDLFEENMLSIRGLNSPEVTRMRRDLQH
jgi:hypothetical protein